MGDPSEEIKVISCLNTRINNSTRSFLRDIWHQETLKITSNDKIIYDIFTNSFNYCQQNDHAQKERGIGARFLRFFRATNKTIPLLTNKYETEKNFGTGKLCKQNRSIIGGLDK